MVGSDPQFNELLECFGVLNEKGCVRFRGDVCHVAIDLISLSAALVEVGGERKKRRSESDFQGQKCGLVMTEADDAVAFAGDHDLLELQDGVVCRGEAAVIR
ncbi:MAG: hypothetical protein NTV52_16485 [Acidobacteria bacterium]|nr:hypothetical protein [Acidobacteriota bacterium]